MNTNDLLTAILAELQKQNGQLGFGHPPKPRYIYANRQYSDALWYHWNGAKNEHEPIAHHALTGIVEKLEIETKEFRGKPDPKVNVLIKADRPYILQAGYDTIFAKGLLYSFSKLPKAIFNQPITIAVEPGETEQVLFCRIYVDGESVYAPYPDNTDWAGLVETCQKKINPQKESAPPRKAETPEPKRNTITTDQIRRLFAISRKAGFDDKALKILIGAYQYISTKDITQADYEHICESAADPKLAAEYNRMVKPEKLPVGTW